MKLKRINKAKKKMQYILIFKGNWNFIVKHICDVGLKKKFEMLFMRQKSYIKQI